MKFNVGFGTDIGRKRYQNQDNGGAYPDLGLFVVADGMGGHRGGETASSMVVEIIPGLIKSAQRGQGWDPKNILTEAIIAANDSIYEKAHADSNLLGMGTTCTSLLFKGTHITVGHVGDSRAYFLQNQEVWQLTRDHSLVQEKFRAGIITREEMKTDRMKNVITRSVGFEKEVHIETYEMETKAGDTFLLCSDGLTGVVDDRKMVELVNKHLFEQGDIKKAVDQLIAYANATGGDDNITVVLLQVLETDAN